MDDESDELLRRERQLVQRGQVQHPRRAYETSHQESCASKCLIKHHGVALECGPRPICVAADLCRREF